MDRKQEPEPVSGLELQSNFQFKCIHLGRPLHGELVIYADRMILGKILPWVLGHLEIQEVQQGQWDPESRQTKLEQKQLILLCWF